ncbi:glycosyl hydrolase family 2 [Arthrobacter sp. SLBN-100]|uniref:glycoside hydrolase family 2 TIM barrel-domain containing protein n=1 Tax=Arthrobacter sp. SLBN-100 TaxID=2768450 RepID=UPI00114D8D51|nr:glycoside hydrolase family 2 TIM barrel-domain containing protein [Arthrobacter sp. SLBN-100]TQJ66261.1 glycosyl hydrolase family 2 [Arthrobacter sp. SLBN-100]
MTPTLFNDNWTVRPKVSIFAEIGQDPASTQEVRLPHDALINQPRQAENSGKTAYFPRSANFEYLKSFHAPEEWRGRAVRLEFQGAYRDAVVYINDEYAGQRPYGYSIFDVHLDDHLIFDAENTIRVEVRAQDDSRWYSGVGITRDVLLHVTDPYRITAYGVHAHASDIDDERAVVDVAVSLTNDRRHRATATTEVTVLDSAGEVVAQRKSPATVSSGKTGISRARVYIPEPTRWSLEDPYLYSVRVRLTDADQILDETTVPLGIRTIRLDPQHGLRINDNPIKLRGACVHHDNGPLGGAAVAAAEERRVRLLKNAGFNAIRSAHNPLSIPMLEACDRLGMIVMDELSDVWTESKSPFDYSLDFPEWWERDLESMVLKDRNHPSVIFYSVGNEIPEIGSSAGAEWNQRLAEKVRDLDPTRFITNGVNGFVAALKDVLQMMRQATDAAGGVNDAMGSAGDMMNQISASELVSARLEEPFSALDVAGINYGDSRYDLDADLNPDRLIVGTETFPGHIDVLWKLVQAHPQVLGDFTWAGWDYLGEVGVGRTRYLDDNDMQFEASYPWISAWVGDLDMTGQRRAISYYREIVFGLRLQPYIAVHRPQLHGRAAMTGGWSWPDAQASWTWSVNVEDPIRVDVYAAADEVELVCNGRSLGRQPIGAGKAFIAEFDVTYEPGILEAIAYKAGVEVSREILTSATGPARIGLNPSASSISDTGNDAAFIEIELRDEHGQLITDADASVSVSVRGAAHLAGLFSGRPNPLEPITGSACYTQDGRALAIIRPDRPGEAQISVTCGELRAEATLSITGSPCHTHDGVALGTILPDQAGETQITETSDELRAKASVSIGATDA